jgi:hypothetical protein
MSGRYGVKEGPITTDIERLQARRRGDGLPEVRLEPAMTGDKTDGRRVYGEVTVLLGEVKPAGAMSSAA